MRKYSHAGATHFYDRLSNRVNPQENVVAPTPNLFFIAITPA